MKNKNNLITIVFGTRPEAIKLAPIIRLMRNNKKLNLRVVITGQHKEMLNQVIDLFNLQIDLDLSIMKKNQTLTHITNKTLNGLEKEFDSFPPSLVIVQGDTTTALAAALGSFYKKIPIAHVEAGLRTDDIYDPFPEEVNRRLISQMASLHFAPTENSYNNLKIENVPGNIFITGNTVIDSLLEISKKAKPIIIDSIDWMNKKIILTTIHRRENRGSKLLNILKALEMIVSSNKDIQIVIPMHKNSELRSIFKNELKKVKNIFLIEPLNYDELVFALKNCYLLLTDSGGLQEEAPTFGKPVFILRETTERDEVVQCGAAKIVGTDPENIFKSVSNILSKNELYKTMSDAKILWRWKCKSKNIRSMHKISKYMKFKFSLFVF